MLVKIIVADGGSRGTKDGLESSKKAEEFEFKVGPAMRFI
jgi:hypothetical protein